MPFCPECGYAIDGQKYCPNCGTKQTPIAQGVPTSSSEDSSISPSYMPAASGQDDMVTQKGRKGDHAPARFLRFCCKQRLRHPISPKHDSMNCRGNESNATSQSRLSVRLGQVRAATASAPDSTCTFSEKDIQDNKGYSVLAYCCFLVFVPLLKNRESEFVKFHAYQGLNVFAGTVLTLIGRSIAVELIEMLRWPDLLAGIMSVIVSLPFLLLLIGMTALSVLGISYSLRGMAKQLPYVGKFNLLGLPAAEDEGEDGGA